MVLGHLWPILALTKCQKDKTKQTTKFDVEQDVALKLVYEWILKTRTDVTSLLLSMKVVEKRITLKPQSNFYSDFSYDMMSHPEPEQGGSSASLAVYPTLVIRLCCPTELASPN